MTQGGALRPIKVITDSDLQENGGSYVLLGNQAIQVTRFSTEERATKGGGVLPVYIVSDSQINDGRFVVRGHDSLPMIEVLNRPVIGNQAIPIYITEDR